MRSGKQLLLTTSVNPFSGFGESAFLADEWGSLLERFSKIFVVPMHNRASTLPIPQGVELVTEFADGAHTPPGRWLKYVQSWATCPELRQEAKRSTWPLRNLTAWQRLSWSWLEAGRFYRWFQGWRKEAKLAPQALCLYAYWFELPCLALVFVKRELPAAPLAVRAHGSDIYEWIHTPPYLPFREVMAESVDAIVCISEHGRGYAREQFPGAAEQVHCFRLGVARPGEMTQPSSDGRFRVLSCARLVPVKRLDRLIRGLAIFAEKHADLALKWNHFGGGPQESKIRKMARDALPGNTEWEIHGNVPRSEILRHYRECPVDCVVNVSESEGLPMSLMEAAAHGIPLIATDVGGNPEICTSANGLLLPASPTAEECADALATLHETSDLAARLREGSRRLWEQQFDAARNANAFADFLSQLQPRRTPTQARS